MSFIYEKMEHINVFDFTLSAKEMEEIAKLDKAESLFFSHYNPEFVNFLIIYKQKKVVCILCFHASKT